jgi:23S rRNA (cytosine1962-C5)-methyltransferase
VFESSVGSGKADPGETVRVQTADGTFVGWAAYSPSSMIRLRFWSFVEDERIDRAFFERRIARAIALRARLSIASDSMRLVHGESDGLPGLIVDRYADTLSAQFLSVGAERWKAVIADALLAATGLTRLYERSDPNVRTLEGLEPTAGWLRGDGTTELTIHEHDLKLTLDVAEGHKTGFYLDQRDNRQIFAETVRRLGLKRVLNCYCYTGGFSVAAFAGGAAHVTSIDSSAPALARTSAHVALNGFDATRHETLDADVNRSLRAMLERGERFDAIVLDPPKFAPTAAHAERAARAYKDINRLAFMLLAPDGVLFTFSCSAGIHFDLFHKIVAGAGMDAGVDAAILHRLHEPADHPSTLLFPEGQYLKGLALLKR